MRKQLILCLLLCSVVSALAGSYRVEDIPNVQRMDRTRYVSNPDDILSAEAVMRIDSLCGALRQKGIAQVAVVAVDEIAGGDPFSFSIDLFKKWGVGNEKNDNGLGILLVRDLHEIRFVTGGGLEGVLPDAICKRIQLKYMLPAFRKGDYSAGMVAGVGAVAQLLEGSELDLGAADSSGEQLPAWMIFVIVCGFVVIPIASSMIFFYRRKRCPKCGALAMALSSQQTLSVTKQYDLIEYTFVCGKCGHTMRRQGKNSKDNGLGGGIGGGTIIGGRGFGGGGSFGGGGGGFGGGSFGGGGAGSRW